MLTGTNLILLPQTYGPFKRSLARTLARVVLSGSAAVYSRDEEGLREIRKLMNGKPMRAVPEVCPDVAFTLDAIRGKTEQTKELERLRSHGQRIIGLNISGLLYNGGYTGKNDFNLKCDYKQVVLEVTRLFAAKDNHVVVLVPHVLPRNFPVENDLEACKALVQSLPAETRQKVIVLDGTYDQSEVKYLIGLCDFFMGARMHSTIAALSQCVPAVAMAYSKKFAGVFQTAGMEDCVVDMRTLSDEDVVQKITEIYANSDAVRARLEKIVPHIKRQVHKMFDDLLTSRQEGMAAGVGGDKAAVRGEDVRKAV
jgi:polysaccharide pyruvyl transferase WcaK-like protein